MLKKQHLLWYIENIEEPIRKLVLLLRNSGINTECSCGHDMYIQCQYILDGQLLDAYETVYNNLHEEGFTVDFEINVKINVNAGHQDSTMEICLPKRRLTKKQYDKITKSAINTTKRGGYEHWKIENQPSKKILD